MNVCLRKCGKHFDSHSGFLGGISPFSGCVDPHTLNDHLHSATVIADQTGAIQKQYHAPYGELHWQ